MVPKNLTTFGFGGDVVASPNGPLIPLRTRVRMPWTHYYSSINDASTVRTYGTQTALYPGHMGGSDPVASTHPPYGWDQIKALYQKYKVVGFEAKFTISNSEANNRAVTTIRVLPANDVSTLTGNSLLYSEKPGAQNFITVAGSGPATVHHLKIDFPATLGITKAQFDNDLSLYSSLVTADPTYSPIIQIATASDTVSKGVYVLIEAIFTVDFWQRTTQAVSA